jgi:hypothetical protein
MIGMSFRPWPRACASAARAVAFAGAFPVLGVVATCGLGVASCASSGRGAEPASDVTVVRHVDRADPDPPAARLAGARCQNGGCTCRQPGDDTEKEAPADGSKRLELRLSVDEGEGQLESPTLGRFKASGVAETCYYLDVPVGSKAGFNFVGRAARPERGFTPRLKVSEYGPAGPFWYEIFSLECAGVSGRCDRLGADAWGERIKTSRKRGRNDPCGSLVVTGLNWETTGGLNERDAGFYRDFVVRFDIEVKKFATQFAPHSTECVPK